MTEVNFERNKVVEKNLGLVHACANRFKGRGVEYDDLFQAGCVGLIKAANNFDESKGFSFSTYAVPVILGEIKRIFRDGGAVKIGRTLKEKSRTALAVREELAALMGREPTVNELAEKMKIDSTEAAMLLNVSMPVMSLTGVDESESQLDIPVDSPEKKISDSLALEQVLMSLEEKDRKMIELRYYSGMTQSKTALQLGMTQVQVSRREKAVLEIIRKKLTT
ncbi:MAG: sigma-70 family RNA polymerase sigma factor [Clostridia bacterium]|nr:sigma-70 family RNA polymerase sigma factor [Clostridia bacterium]